MGRSAGKHDINQFNGKLEILTDPVKFKQWLYGKNNAQASFT